MCRVNAVLVIPAAIGFFSLWASPCGLPVLRGFRREIPPHGGSGIGANLRETPVFMRLRSTLPFVTMRPGGGQSQWKNCGFPQFSSVFWGYMPILAGFSRVLAHQSAERRDWSGFPALRSQVKAPGCDGCCERIPNALVL